MLFQTQQSLEVNPCTGRVADGEPWKCGLGKLHRDGFRYLYFFCGLCFILLCQCEVKVRGALLTAGLSMRRKDMPVVCFFFILRMHWENSFLLCLSGVEGTYKSTFITPESQKQDCRKIVFDRSWKDTVYAVRLRCLRIWCQKRSIWNETTWNLVQYAYLGNGEWKDDSAVNFPHTVVNFFSLSTFGIDLPWACTEIHKQIDGNSPAHLFTTIDTTVFKGERNLRGRTEGTVKSESDVMGRMVGCNC